MLASLAERILAQLPAVSEAYSRLLLVVGPPRSGKTTAFANLVKHHGWSRINVNLQLAERLLDLTQKQRAVRVAGILDDVLKASASDVVLLDNIEMLFAAELSLDPLRLLQGLSRNRTIVASWPGHFDGQTLTYADPGHREFRKYVAPQVAIVSTASAHSADLAAREETR